MATFELECGEELHLQSVSSDALQHLISDGELFEVYELAASGDDADFASWMSNLSPERQGSALQSVERLLNYCIGWGVTDDPPEEAEDELELLGVDLTKRRVARVEWVRLLLLESQVEAGQLISDIMTLSYRESGAEPVEPGD